MACWCLSTPLNTTFETSLTATRLTTNTTTISLTKLTTVESESEEFGPRAVESRGAVGTVVRATSQLDMLDRVVVFLTRLVTSKEPRYLFEDRAKPIICQGYTFIYVVTVVASVTY